MIRSPCGALLGFVLVACMAACNRSGDPSLQAPRPDSGIASQAAPSGISAVLAPAAQSDRYALVFGNGRYRHGDALSAPPRDAALMARALEARGYRVLLALDRDLAGMREDLRAFEAMSRDAEVRVLYFAGHGFEFDNANYLMPVDLPANIADLDRDDVRTNALRLDQVTSELEQGTDTLVAIIDTCRVVPTRGGADARTLAAQDPPNGTILAYATAPGRVAMDSLRTYGVDEDHSPYTYYLANVLLSPDVDTWDQALLATYNIVSTQTRGEQQPWMNARVSRFPAIGDMSMPLVGAAPAFNVLGIRVTPDRKAAGRYWARENVAIQRLAADGSISDDDLGQRMRNGDDPAAIALADRWSGVPERAERVIGLLEPVAERGNALAQTDLGTYLYAKRGKDSHGHSARYWWQLASAQGIGEARGKLALLDGGNSQDALREFMQGVVEMQDAYQGN